MNVMISGCERDNKVYSDFLTFDNNINIESITSTEKSTLDQYLEKKPDILILDLTAKNLNSLYILSELSVSSPAINKKIILITDNYSANFINRSQFSDVLSKPITKETLLNSIYKVSSTKTKTITVQDVKKLFLNLKIDLYSTGIHYLIEAVLIAAQEHRLLQNLQDIYEMIGQKHNIGFEKVKWSIRSTIETINKYADAELFSTVFKYYDDTRTLTPKYFIKLVLYYFDIDADED